eukprot:3163436-Rhodomonas_salina.2
MRSSITRPVTRGRRQVGLCTRQPEEAYGASLGLRGVALGSTGARGLIQRCCRLGQYQTGHSRCAGRQEMLSAIEFRTRHSRLVGRQGQIYHTLDIPCVGQGIAGA